MTAVEVPGTDGDTLRVVLDDLRRMDADDPHVRLALAEGEFRLAIAPGTPVDEAIMLLRSALTHDPFLAKGYLHLGRLLHRRGRHHAAAAEYLAGLELAPTSRRMHLLLAEALLEMGKPEQQAGEALIHALAGRDPERVRTAAAAVTDLLRGGTDDAAEGGEKDGTRRGRAPRKRSSPAPDGLGDLWLIWLSSELGRGAKLAEVDAALRAGADDVEGTGRTEFVVGCLLALLTGHPPGRVRSATATVDLDDAGPATQVHRALTSLLDLAEAPTPADFLRSAAAVLTDGALPAVVVHVLHHRLFGPGRQPLVDALRMVDAYPPAFRRDDGLQELRIALLDHHAAEAWDAGAPARARLLWREVLAIDPLRVPAAVNLALLAGRVDAAEEYESAWERLFELLYLTAAGVGDVQLQLDQRRDLHLALVRQSWQRHCASTPSGGVPTAAELDAWLADTDALAVWLRDWDGYYVNARLAFRSPLHLLGVPRDVSPEGLADARGSLERHVEAVVGNRGWVGHAVFRRLAATGVEDAHARIVEPIERTRDPYFELEKERSDALAGEIVHRMLVLRSLLIALARVPATTARAEQAAALVRHQALLPRAILRTLLVDRGLVERDIDPAELVEDAVVGLATRWARAKDADESHRATLAACLDAIVGVLPGSLTLRVLHARALHAANRPSDAYATSMAALRSSSAEDGDQTTELRGILLDLIDRIGYDEVPSALATTPTVAEAKAMTGPLEASLERYPASTPLRVTLARLYLALDRAESNAARQGRATELLVHGIVEALDDRRSEELADILTTIASGSVVTAVRGATADLTARARDATADAALATRLSRCRDLARRYDLAGSVTVLERVLAQCTPRGVTPCS